MVYLVIFCIASICFAASQRNTSVVISFDRRKLFRASTIYGVFGILVLSIIAGIRSSSVGVDVETYVISSFFRVSNYTSFLTVIENHKLELGYEFLEYFVSRINADVHYLHFATALIVTGCTYTFIKRFSDKISIAMAMLVFMCMYFNQSLNIVRQWLAIAIYIGIGGGHLIERKSVKYFLSCTLAMLFHTSAIITFPIYFIYGYLNTGYRHQKRALIIIVITTLCILFFDKICMGMIGIGVLPSKYLHYLVDSGEGTSSLAMNILQRLPLLILSIWLKGDLDKYDNKNNIWFCFVVLEFLIGMLASRFGYASRFVLYFSVWQCMYYSEVYRMLRRKIRGKGKFFLTSGFIVMFLLYWTYCYVIRGFSGTVPYTSDVLFILGNN